jgi:hypothetical protein
MLRKLPGILIGETAALSTSSSLLSQSAWWITLLPSVKNSRLGLSKTSILRRALLGASRCLKAARSEMIEAILLLFDHTFSDVLKAGTLLKNANRFLLSVTGDVQVWRQEHAG